MSNTNTPPPLYALTPIDQTEGLEDGKVYTIELDRNNAIRLMRGKDGWIDPSGDEIKFNEPCNYLRPLPEGTQVLQPGEVAVSEEELKHLRECKNKLSELEIEYDRLHEEAMIWKYESGNT